MREFKSEVQVIGLGRVGLMTCFELAEKGHSVVANDKDAGLIDELSNGKLSFHEPQFGALLHKHKGSISFFSDRPKKDIPFNFICIPTPIGDQGRLDHSQINNLLSDFKPNNYGIIRSTLSPGTHKILQTLFPDLHFIYYPEFYREGQFVEDQEKKTTSYFGGHPTVLSEVSGKLDLPGVFLSFEEAEILKISSNVFHSLKVSFANEVGRASKKFGASASAVMKAICDDTILNISTAYLKPGFCYSGPCLIKDTRSWGSTDKGLKIGEAIDSSNQEHLEWIARSLLAFKASTIGFLGRSFKQKSKDPRDSLLCKLGEVIQVEGQPVYFLNEPFLPSLAEQTLSLDLLVEKCDLLVISSAQLEDQQWLKLKKFSGKIIDLHMQRVPESIKSMKSYISLYD